MKLLGLFMMIYLITLNTQAEQNSRTGFYVGYGIHTVGKSIPWPLIELGYNHPKFSFRHRTGVIAGRSAFELALRHENTTRLYPYITKGGNYYVVGHDSLYGVGLEYVAENQKNYALLEWTYLEYRSFRSGNKDLSKNTISLGVGRRF